MVLEKKQSFQKAFLLLKSVVMSQSQYKLRILQGKFTNREYSLSEGGNLIGRWDPETASFPLINLEDIDVDAKVSRKHAQVDVAGNKVTIQDLDSLNGTYINQSEEALPSGTVCSLIVGDEIAIGKTVFRLEKK